MSAVKVELGRRLFHDTRLSGNGTFSCASCHVQELGFADGQARAAGSTHEIHPRGAMSLTNVAYNATLGWANPELTTLEAQARVPMFNVEPVELGLLGLEEELLERLQGVDGYRRLFAESFPGSSAPITLPNVVRALASFERTLISGNSAYDRLTFGGDSDALSASAKRGMRLFFSEELACSKCHGGFNFSGPVQFEAGRQAEPTFHNTGLYNLDGRGAMPSNSPGLREHTGRRRDSGRFRAPTLRNIAVTAPYMHDGSIATLEEVLEHYAGGGRRIASGPHAGDGRHSPHKSELVRGFPLNDQNRTDLVAFLRSLTDEAFLREPRFGSPGTF
jgi:cytochrome c peroxidase